MVTLGGAPDAADALLPVVAIDGGAADATEAAAEVGGGPAGGAIEPPEGGADAAGNDAGAGAGLAGLSFATCGAI